MSLRSSRGRPSDEQVRHLKIISARIVKGGILDAASWKQISLTGSSSSTLQCVLNQIPNDSSAKLKWILSSMEGQAVLECMQAIIQHGPAAMHAATAASARDEALIPATPLTVSISFAVSSVVGLILCNDDNLWHQAWPTGTMCCMQAMRDITMQLPLKDFDVIITSVLAMCLTLLDDGMILSHSQSHEVDLCIAWLKGITVRGSVLLRTKRSLDGADFAELNSTWLTGLGQLHSIFTQYKCEHGSLPQTSLQDELTKLNSILTQFKAITTGDNLNRTSDVSKYEDELQIISFKLQTNSNELQRVIPFLVKSFHLAWKIIMCSPITDQDVMDQMFRGLTLPIGILAMIVSSSSWLIQCILKTAKLVSDQQEKQRLWDTSENKDVLTRPLMTSNGFSFLSDVDRIAKDVSAFVYGIRTQRQFFEALCATEELSRLLFSQASTPEVLDYAIQYLQVSLWLVSFLLRRGSAEGDTTISKFSLYNTAAANKGALRPTYLRALSVLITAAKVSVLHPQLFASKSLDVMWSSAWARLSVWGLVEADLDFYRLSSYVPVLQLVPVLLSRSICERQQMVQAVRPLPLLAAYVVRHAHGIDPSLGLAILTSTQVWSFLEAGVKLIISGPGQLQPSSSTDGADQILSDSSCDHSRISQSDHNDAVCVITAYLAFLMEYMSFSAVDLPLVYSHEFQLQDLNKGFISIDLLRSISSSFYIPFRAGLVSEFQLLSKAHLTNQGQADCFTSSLISVVLLRPSHDGLRGLNSCRLKSPSLYSAAPTHISVLSFWLGNPLWELLLQQQQPLPDGTLLSILPLMISSLYQAVAIVEVFLESSGDKISFTPDIEQHWQDARFSIGELVTAGPSDINGLPRAALRLRSSLLHLTEVVKICVGGSSPFVPRDWELVLLELMMDVNDEVWGVRPCGNLSCTRLEGSCELTVKTFACGGECGMRYCCRSCQEEAWRAGHGRNCKRMREKWDAFFAWKVEQIKKSEAEDLGSTYPEVQDLAAPGSSKLASDDINMETIATAKRNRVIPLIVANLDPQHSAEKQRDAAYILGDLSEIDGNKVQIAAAGAIPPLVALLGPQFSAVAKEAAAWALGVIAQNDDNRVTITAAGAIPPLVEMMDPSCSTSSHEMAAFALGSLVPNYDGWGSAGVIIAAGAIPHLIAMLGPDSTGNQVHMLWTLLMHVDDDCLVIAAGAIPPLVEMLKSPCADDVLHKALCVLVELSRNNDNQIEMSSRGAIAPLVAIMNHSEQSSLGQILVIEALSNCSHIDGNGILISAAMAPIVALLDSPAHSAAAMTLLNLSVKVDYHAFIVAAGAIPPLLALLRPEYSAELQKVVTETLGNLLKHDDRSKAAIMAADAIPLLVELSGPQHSDELQDLARFALRRLNDNDSLK